MPAPAPPAPPASTASPAAGFSGLWTYSPATDQVRVDLELALAFGLAELGALAEFLAVVDAADAEQLAATIAACAAAGGRFDRHFLLARGVHRGHWARLCGQARLQQGQWCLHGVITDLPAPGEQMERWRDSEQRFRMAFDQTPQTAVQGYDRHRRVIYWNDASEHLYGYRREEALGRQLEDLIIPPPAREIVIRLHEAWVEQGIPIPADELQLLRKDGSLVPVFSSHVMLRNGWGEPEMYCIDVDLRPQRQALREGSQRETRLRLVSQAAHAVWWEWTPDSDELRWSEAAASLLGAEPAPASLAQWCARLVEPEARALAEDLQRLAAGEGSFDRELELGEGRGRRALLLHAERHPGEASVVGTLVDISESKAAAARIDELVHIDPVTGLPNRVRLRDRLQRSLLAAGRSGRKVVLACIGLDRFKLVNESYGLAAGDRLLKACAERIQAALRASDAVMRLGGDQFVVVLDDVAREADAERLADKLLQEFQRPFQLDEHEVFVAASMGLSVFPGDGDQAEVMIQHAETALHRVKEMGRAHYQFFRAEMNRRAVERLELGSRLRRALEAGELHLHLQPEIRLQDERMVGAEALLRWQAGELGWISPERFIPLAEDSGLIEPIGAWVLARACEIARDWRAAGHSDLVMAVNLSVRQFRSRALVDRVAAELSRCGLPPAALELEITESVLLDEEGLTRELLFALKELGVGIAIDDFGTGYSSLSYLRRFPVDVLKIDRSFIRDAATEPDAAALVRAILGLAQSLHLDVVAEGVETRGQADFLRQAGCNYAQGWLYGRAVDPAEFARVHLGAAPLRHDASR